MKPIQLSLSPKYCPDWGIWEGIRELVQNWMDCRDAGHKSSMKYKAGTLTLTNLGTEITPDQLTLIGETTKAGERARGKFGEGVKVGMLALCRAGLGVQIISGRHVWTASIEPSPTGARVLTLRGQKRREKHRFDGVCVAVSDLPVTEWDRCQERLRLHNDPGILYGSPGRIFVRGIWVCDLDCAYGYDFDRADMDRDRNLVKDFSLRWEMSRLIVRSWRKGEITAEEILSLIQSGASDVAHIKSHGGSDLMDALETVFREAHGPDAVPVRNETEAQMVRDRKLRPIVTSNNMPDSLVQRLHAAVDKPTIRRYYVPERDLPLDDLNRFRELVALAKLKPEPILCGFYSPEDLSFLSPSGTVCLSVDLLKRDDRFILRTMIQCRSEAEDIPVADAYLDVIDELRSRLAPVPW